jgi:putative peptide zinc metalloprotease protein
MAIISPIMKVLSQPIKDPQLKERSYTIYTGCVIAAVVLSMFIFLVPVPLATRAEGVIWVSEQAQVYAEESGFINKIVAGTNDPVVEGETIISMVNVQLEMKVRVLQAQVKESKARYEANIGDKNLAEVLKEDYQYVLLQYYRASDRLDKLQIKARYSGTLIIPKHENLPGRFVHRGKILGYIVDYDKLPTNIMVTENDIDRIISNTNKVELRFVSHPKQIYTGVVSRVMPSASKKLISPVLSVEGGGSIALDPGDPNRSTTFQDYYRVEVDLPDAPKTSIDERVYVLFRHDNEPLAGRWYRVIRRIFLRNFGA